MAQDIFSVDQVAEYLGLHPKTVRRHVSEGKLKAVRIGKQYRIARHDLEQFMGCPLPQAVHSATGCRRSVEVSSVIQVDAISKDSFSSLSNMLVAAANGRKEGEAALRLDTIYNEELGRMKIVCLGSLADNADLFAMIDNYLKAER